MKRADVLRDLAQPWNVAVHSTSELAGSVAKAATVDDKAKREKGQAPLRRKPELRPLPIKPLGVSLQLTPWDVLHCLGRASVLARQGAGRGLAEHWASLKYCQALTGNDGRYMALSTEGRNPRRHYAATQSGELGIGFALALARRVLASQYPDHSVSVIDAEIAMRAGWTLTGKEAGRSSAPRRPGFFLEVWQPGEPSRVIPVTCKGTHGHAAQVHKQLATASADVEGTHIGPYNETPAFVFGTTLPKKSESITLYLLQAPGDGTLWDAKDLHLDPPVEDRSIRPGIDAPTGPHEEPPVGYHVRPEECGWFGRVLAQADAAGLMAFTGGGEPTAQYLTKRQGKGHFETFTHAGTGIVQDVTHTIHGKKFVGTDHVFRLNGVRVEAFSGLAEDLFDHLRDGRVEQYRHEAHNLRDSWDSDPWDAKWRGPVSLHPDGTVMALRRLRLS
ncbi:hypothetical protein ABT144_12695 [Streptomyces sp. NPDC002039]|uniref:hypothetical protein n=1 Tax=Streptomyces sp. NPDC002039 TaxID=3154660 RepID=UPI003316A216